MNVYTIYYNTFYNTIYYNTLYYNKKLLFSRTDIIPEPAVASSKMHLEIVSSYTLLGYFPSTCDPMILIKQEKLYCHYCSHAV